MLRHPSLPSTLNRPDQPRQAWSCVGKLHSASASFVLRRQDSCGVDDVRPASEKKQTIPDDRYKNARVFVFYHNVHLFSFESLANDEVVIFRHTLLLTRILIQRLFLFETLSKFDGSRICLNFSLEK